MQFKILNLSQKQEWNDSLAKLPVEQQDIYYTPEYYSLYEANGDGKACCFVFEKYGDIALYPFLINSVNELGYDLDKEYYDIQGAYGYNGVVASSYDDKFTEDFYKFFLEYCVKQNIIAEFTRFHPILKNHKFAKNYELINANLNVVVNLTDNDIWMNSYEHSTRKNIKKALRNDLFVKCLSGLKADKHFIKEFVEIYNKTMDRNGAKKFYYFNYGYFNKISSEFGDRAKFFFTFKDDKIISCELVICGSEIGYSFLGGTLTDYYKYRPNDILKHNIIENLKQDEYKYFCLGGGISPNDGIFNYKKKFSKNGIYKFFIGKKIHNNAIYNNIIEQWKKKTNNTDNKRLLRYRENL